MATPPRGRSNTKRPGAQDNRSKIIDLDAKDVKDTSQNDAKETEPKSASAASTKQSPTNKVTASKTPPASATPRPTVPKTGSVNKATASQTAAKVSNAKSAPKQSTAEKTNPPSGKSTEKTKSSQAPIAPASANNSTGFGKLIAAGIVGSVITLGGAGIMQYSDMLPNLGSASDAQPLPTIDLTPLQSKLTQLQDQVDGLSGGAVSAKPIDLSPLETRLAALENRPATPNTSVVPSSQSAESGFNAQQLEEKIAQLSSEIAALKSTAQSAAVKMSEIEEATPKQDTGTLIDLAIAPLKNSNDKVNDKLGALEQKFSALSTKIDEDVDARINAFDEKLKNAATGEKLAKSVAVNALKSAVEKGESFSGALTSLETLTGPSKPIDWLKSVANSGIPTDQSLQSEFSELQSGILLAATNDPNATVTDRLMSSISSLVTVSSSEAVSGGSPQAIISRVAANLKSGNFGAAISEWKSLPDEAQQASKVWMEKLSLRMDADRQMYKLLKSVQADG